VIGDANYVSRLSGLNVRYLRPSVQSPFSPHKYRTNLLFIEHAKPTDNTENEHSRLRIFGARWLSAPHSTPSHSSQSNIQTDPLLSLHDLSLMHSLNFPFQNVRTFRERWALGSMGMEIASVQLAGISPIPPDVLESGRQMEITTKYSPFTSLPATKVPLYGLCILTATFTVRMSLIMEFREEGHYAGLLPREYSLGKLRQTVKFSSRNFYNFEWNWKNAQS